MRMDPRALPLLRNLPGAAALPPLVLEIDLSGGVLAKAPTDPLSALRQRHTPTLPDIVTALRHACGDDRVAAVILLGGNTIRSAQADEIGAGLDAVRASGTATYAFSESFGELGPGTIAYGLAARCEHVWVQPSGQLGLTGIASAVTLLRGVLDRLGVEPQFAQRHEFKTAADQLAAPEVSEANREMTTRLTASAMEQISATIADRRGMSADVLAEIVDRAPLSAVEARDGGLVDRIGYRDELYAAVRAAHGEDVELVFAHRYAKRRAKRSPVAQVRRRSAPQVAVVAVHGAIVGGRSREGRPGPVGDRAGSDTVVAALRAAQGSDRVRAVVLHVDSPGGSYVASDAIRRAVLGLRASGRPVVASMGGVAASGGYFVAMGADRVLALPTTITGSIGVLAGKFVVAGLTQRLGVVRELVATGANATMFAPDAGFTDEQRARLDGWLDEVYDDFTRKAAEDRGMAWNDLEPLARGRVWTGADALHHRLVDELGGRDAAIAHACRLARLHRDAADVVDWPAVSLVERLKPAESTHAPAAAVAHPALGGPEAWLASLGEAAGAPTGVLSLPWPVELR